MKDKIGIGLIAACIALVVAPSVSAAPGDLDHSYGDPADGNGKQGYIDVPWETGLHVGFASADMDNAGGLILGLNTRNSCGGSVPSLQRISPTGKLDLKFDVDPKDPDNRSVIGNTSGCGSSGIVDVTVLPPEAGLAASIVFIQANGGLMERMLSGASAGLEIAPRSNYGIAVDGVTLPAPPAGTSSRQILALGYERGNWSAKSHGPWLFSNTEEFGNDGVSLFFNTTSDTSDCSLLGSPPATALKASSSGGAYVSGFRWLKSSSSCRPYIARLTSTGQLDPLFGGGDGVVGSIGGTAAIRLLIAPDGKLLSLHAGSGGGVAMRTFTPTGKAVGEPVTVLASGLSLVDATVLRDGRIALLAYSEANRSLKVLLVNPDGTPVDTWGSNGTASPTAFPVFPDVNSAVGVIREAPTNNGQAGNLIVATTSPVNRKSTRVISLKKPNPLTQKDYSKNYASACSSPLSGEAVRIPLKSRKLFSFDPAAIPFDIQLAASASFSWTPPKGSSWCASSDDGDGLVLQKIPGTGIPISFKFSSSSPVFYQVGGAIGSEKIKVCDGPKVSSNPTLPALKGKGDLKDRVSMRILSVSCPLAISWKSIPGSIKITPEVQVQAVTSPYRVSEWLLTQVAKGSPAVGWTVMSTKVAAALKTYERFQTATKYYKRGLRVNDVLPITGELAEQVVKKYMPRWVKEAIRF